MCPRGVAPIRTRPPLPPQEAKPTLLHRHLRISSGRPSPRFHLLVLASRHASPEYPSIRF